MLPDINANNWGVREERILVGGGDDLKTLGGCVDAEPAPSRALDTSGSRVELFLKVVERAKRTNDSILQGTVVENTAVSTLLLRRSQVLPEQTVIDVTTAVELEGSLESDALFGSRSLCVSSFGSVERVDIGLVVLGVVKSHNLLRDVWLKSIVGVRERRQTVGHFL